MIDRFCLIIGAMKSGTTALFRNLAQHPEIAPCSQKEPNFFSHREVREKGMDWYRSLWDWEPAHHRWALEASTNYAKLPVHPNGALPASRVDAELRIVYVVRDPVDRIRSQYVHALAEGWLPQPITAGVAPHAILFSNYRFQILPWQAFFGSDRILIVKYEDFRDRRELVLRRICGFLGIDADFPFANTGPQNSSLDFRKRLFAKLLVERDLAPAEFDPKTLAHLAFDRFVEQCALDLGGPANGDRIRAMDAELRAAVTPSPLQVEQIREELRVDLELFREEWGIDPWGRTAGQAGAAPALRPAVTG